MYLLPRLPRLWSSHIHLCMKDVVRHFFPSRQHCCSFASKRDGKCLQTFLQWAYLKDSFSLWSKHSSSICFPRALVVVFHSSLPPGFASVSFCMHHNWKTSSLLNIASNWSDPHVTFGMFGPFECTTILFNLNRSFQNSRTSESLRTSFPASSQPLAFCCHCRILF